MKRIWILILITVAALFTVRCAESEQEGDTSTVRDTMMEEDITFTDDATNSAASNNIEEGAVLATDEKADTKTNAPAPKPDKDENTRAASQQAKKDTKKEVSKTKETETAVTPEPEEPKEETTRAATEVVPAPEPEPVEEEAPAREETAKTEPSIVEETAPVEEAVTPVASGEVRLGNTGNATATADALVESVEESSPTSYQESTVSEGSLGTPEADVATPSSSSSSGGMRSSIPSLAEHFMTEINSRRTRFYKYVNVAHPNGSGMTQIRADCSGFVAATISMAGVKVNKNSTVASLYSTFRSRGKLYKNRLPKTGDIIFFDNTWDKNGNGRRDDSLTHIAVVEYATSDGTIHFFHCVIDEGGYAACSRGYGNIYQPSDPSVNYEIGVYGTTYYCAGELIRSFASIQ